MKVLTVGSGVIGTVYGAHLAAEGHAVSVLRHPPRTDHVAADGLRARDVLGGRYVHVPVRVVRMASADQYDLVLVAVRADQLKAACAQLTTLTGNPAVLLFGNNPGGRSSIGGVAGELRQGFPGIGGVLHDGVAEYVRIPQQPTALEACSDPRLAVLDGSARLIRVRRPAGHRHGWVAPLPRSVRGLRRRRPVPLRHRSKATGRRPGHNQPHVCRAHRGVRRAPPGRPGRGAA